MSLLLFSASGRVVASRFFEGYAELPRVTPSWDRSAFLAYSGGDLHQPSNASELGTLLSGGELNGQTLKRGDRIVLAAGTNYNTGVATQTFPSLAGSVFNGSGVVAPEQFVHVRSSSLALLPPAGGRVGDAHVSHMPLFEQQTGGGAPPFAVGAGASGYVFSGMRVTGGAVTTTSRILEIGPATPASPSDCPDWVIVDRCHASTTASNASTRAVMLHTRTAIIEGSHIFNHPRVGGEDQGIAGWNAIGPVLIDNNYIVGGSINILFGGSARAAGFGTTTVGIEDVTITRNHLVKLDVWNQNHPDYGGTNYQIKNLFELKHGARVLFERNLLENYWADDQSYTINIKTDQAGAHEATEDVCIRNNRMVNVSSVVTINTFGDLTTSRGCRRVEFVGNLVEGLGSAYTPTTSSLRVVCDFVAIRRNTFVNPNATASLLSLSGSTTRQGFVMTDNVASRQAFGVKGDGMAEGTASLAAAFTSYAFVGNAIIGASSGSYPVGNAFPATIAAAGFVDAANNDWTLTGASVLKGTASDGGDPGANVALVLAQTAGCSTGVWA